MNEKEILKNIIDPEKQQIVSAKVIKQEIPGKYLLEDHMGRIFYAYSDLDISPQSWVKVQSGKILFKINSPEAIRNYEV